MNARAKPAKTRSNQTNFNFMTFRATVILKRPEVQSWTDFRNEFR